MQRVCSTLLPHSKEKRYWSTGVISRHMFPRGSETSLSPLAQDWILISLERGPPVSTARGKSAFRHSSPFTPLKGRHPCYCFSWNLILGSLFISWSCYPTHSGALRVCGHQTFFAWYRRWITIESMQSRLSSTDRKSEKDAREGACRSSCSLDFEPLEWSLLFRAHPLRIERCDELKIRGIRDSVSLTRHQPN